MHCRLVMILPAACLPAVFEYAYAATARSALFSLSAGRA
jgi:hypothetical protein